MDEQLDKTDGRINFEILPVKHRITQVQDICLMCTLIIFKQICNLLIQIRTTPSYSGFGYSFEIVENG